MGFTESAIWKVREAHDRYNLLLSFKTETGGTIEDVRREIDAENDRRVKAGGEPVMFAIIRHRKYTLTKGGGLLVASGTSSSVVEYYPKEGK